MNAERIQVLCVSVWHHNAIVVGSVQSNIDGLQYCTSELCGFGVGAELSTKAGT